MSVPGSALEEPDSSAIIDQLAQSSILVPRTHEVDGYLSSHPELGRLLPNIGAMARQAFGPDAELSLEVYQDPEIDDAYLTLYVRQETYGADLMDRIEMVSRSFDGSLEKVSGYFLITTDFRRPRVTNSVLSPRWGATRP
jgi:hypothetical protein